MPKYDINRIVLHGYLLLLCLVTTLNCCILSQKPAHEISIGLQNENRHRVISLLHLSVSVLYCNPDVGGDEGCHVAPWWVPHCVGSGSKEEMKEVWGNSGHLCDKAVWVVFSYTDTNICIRLLSIIRYAVELIFGDILEQC